MKIRLAIIGVVLGCAGFVSAPAWGCLNDRSTITAENEFKSSYLKKKKEEAAPSPVNVSVGGWIAIGMGVAFTGFAGVMTFRGKRR